MSAKVIIKSIHDDIERLEGSYKELSIEEIEVLYMLSARLERYILGLRGSKENVTLGDNISENGG